MSDGSTHAVIHFSGGRSTSRLDEPAIVAILDAPNAYDIETGRAFDHAVLEYEVDSCNAMIDDMTNTLLQQ